MERNELLTVEEKKIIEIMRNDEELKAKILLISQRHQSPAVPLAIPDKPE